MAANQYYGGGPPQNQGQYYPPQQPQGYAPQGAYPQGGYGGPPQGYGGQPQMREYSLHAEQECRRLTDRTTEYGGQNMTPLQQKQASAKGKSFFAASSQVGC